MPQHLSEIHICYLPLFILDHCVRLLSTHVFISNWSYEDSGASTDKFKYILRRTRHYAWAHIQYQNYVVLSRTLLPTPHWACWTVYLPIINKTYTVCVSYLEECKRYGTRSLTPNPSVPSICVHMWTCHHYYYGLLVMLPFNYHNEWWCVRQIIIKLYIFADVIILLKCVLNNR